MYCSGAAVVICLRSIADIALLYRVGVGERRSPVRTRGYGSISTPRTASRSTADVNGCIA
jgi:hypothetical protein